MTDIIDKKHARLGPSGAYWWGTCPGAPSMTDALPHTSNLYADKGTVMHEVAAYCLWDDLLEEARPEPQNAESYLGRIFTICDRETGEVTREIEFTMEMADIVNDYTAYAHTLVDLAAGDILMVEVEVPISHVTGEPDATGTSDVIAITNGGTVMRVIDLKTGSGVPVYAEDNDQLAMYAMGSLEAIGELKARKIEKIVGHIAQPPRNTFDDFSWTKAELGAAADRLALAAARVRRADVEPDPSDPVWAEQYLVPSDKACKFCDAKANCPALSKTALTTVAPALVSNFPNLEPSVAKAVAANLTPPVDESSERLAQVWKARDLISGYLSAVEAEIDRRLYDGQEVPGLGLFIGRAGNRRYKDETQAEEVLKGSRLGVDAIYERKLISPAKAEKLLKKEKPRVWAKLAALIDQPEGKPSADLLTCGKTPYRPLGAEAFPNLGVADDDPLLN